MARIRSLHPGLFTDEAYMSLSMAARVLITGIWTEADDNGVFQWKPITLKARILPADNVDVAALLGELARFDFINRFEHGGSVYGAVRNFRLFQRPKKPNCRFVIPSELRTYVGLSQDDTEEVGNQFPTSGENPPQMEGRGEESREEEKESSLRSEVRARAEKIDRKPQTRIPDNWKPLEVGYRYGKELGLSDAEIVKEAERFRNHARQSDRMCSDWGAAWQNWALKALELLGRSMPSDKPKPRGIHVKADTPQWDAWTRHRGKALPRDSSNGWLFPTEWPPGMEPAAA